MVMAHGQVAAIVEFVFRVVAGVRESKMDCRSAVVVGILLLRFPYVRLAGRFGVGCNFVHWLVLPVVKKNLDCHLVCQGLVVA